MHFLNVMEVYYTLLSAPSLRVAIGPVVADDVYCC
jgi:hypothetical protein